MKNQAVLILVAAAVVGGAVYGVMFTSLGNYFVPDGPRGFLLPKECPTCRADFRRGSISEPHGHVVYFIEPQDKLRRDGQFWRYRWLGYDASSARDAFLFLESREDAHPAYVAAKHGDAEAYGDVLFGDIKHEGP